MLLDEILAQHEVTKSSSIYDFGCNRGYMLRYLFNADYTNLFWFDLDFSYQQYVADIARYATLDEPKMYDVIIMAKVLCMMNCKQRESIIRRLYSKLSYGGILILEEYNTLAAMESGVKKSLLTKFTRTNRLLNPDKFDKFYRGRSLLNNTYSNKFYRIKQKIVRNTDVAIIYGP